MIADTENAEAINHADTDATAREARAIFESRPTDDEPDPAIHSAEIARQLLFRKRSLELLELGCF